MDLSTVLGILIAIGAVIGGQMLEGGHPGSIAQPTAAIIVLGGTLGACAVQFPGRVLKRALSSLKIAFKPPKHDMAGTLQLIVGLANKARRDGLVALEKDAEQIADPFLRKAFELAIDGTDVKALRGALELELGHEEEEGENPAKVYEAAGGYSPTVGIIGAVLGLIHVMENLSDPSKLGGGIAVAFVATVYGVGVANLFFLPIATKLKIRHRERMLMMELSLEGACAVADGENPRLIEQKLAVYAHEREHGASKKDAEAVAARVASEA
jgi:chemotaxis protein MotA